MTEQELMQEALEWREHIAKLAADYSDQKLFRKRLATFDWLIKQAERVEELEKELEQVKVAYDDRVFDIETLQEENKRYKQALEGKQ